MSYFLSPALFTLRAQIDKKHPKRDRRSDGWIGDAAHSARKSEHNPDWSDGGIVRAIDVDKDGVDMDAIIEMFINDPRAWYVIWQGRIRYGKYVTGVPQGWKTYTGANKHTMHAHFSVRKVGNYDRQSKAWTWRNTPGELVNSGKTAPWTAAFRAAKLNRQRVLKLQRGLNKVFPSYAKLRVTGNYDEPTYRVVIEFQRREGLTPDGIPGPKTRSALGRYGVRF